MHVRHCVFFKPKLKEFFALFSTGRFFFLLLIAISRFGCSFFSFSDCVLFLSKSKPIYLDTIERCSNSFHIIFVYRVTAAFFPSDSRPDFRVFLHTLSILRCYLQMCLDLVLVLAAAARRRLTALSPFFLNQIIYLVWGIFIAWHWIWFFLQGSSGVFCVVLIIEKI